LAKTEGFSKTMEPAEEILLKALFVSEKANNPYYAQHLKYSNRPRLRGLYYLADFMPLVNQTLEEMEPILKNNPSIERIGPKLISLTVDGLLYCQKVFDKAADDDKQQPVGFIK
jgi:hypothetical protein